MGLWLTLLLDLFWFPTKYLFSFLLPYIVTSMFLVCLVPFLPIFQGHKWNKRSKRSLWMAPLTHWGIGDLLFCSLIRVECRLLRLTLKEAWSGQAWRRHIFRLLRTELPTLVLHSLVVHALPDTLLDSVLC